MPFSLSLKAYSKIVLHCCKYPHKAVNGVVIGSVSKKDQSVQIQDAIPLFHLGLGLAPMLEVALAQVYVYIPAGIYPAVLFKALTLLVKILYTSMCTYMRPVALTTP